MMKKAAFILTILCALVSGVAFGQAQATLNVKLYPIQTIMIGGDNTVNLEYKTKDDYLKGVTSDMKDHLVVYSTGGFAVKVKSENEDLVYTKDALTSKIAANTINLQAKLGTDNKLNSSTMNNVVLSNENQNLISSAVGGTELKFNVAYNGKGGNDYVNKYYNVETPNVNVYTTAVTYTIEAQ